MKKVTWKIELFANGDIILRGDVEDLYSLSLFNPYSFILREHTRIDFNIYQVIHHQPHGLFSWIRRVLDIKKGSDWDE